MKKIKKILAITLVMCIILTNLAFAKHEHKPIKIETQVAPDWVQMTYCNCILPELTEYEIEKHYSYTDPNQQLSSNLYVDANLAYINKQTVYIKDNSVKAFRTEGEYLLESLGSINMVQVQQHNFCRDSTCIEQMYLEYSQRQNYPQTLDIDGRFWSSTALFNATFSIGDIDGIEMEISHEHKPTKAVYENDCVAKIDLSRTNKDITLAIKEHPRNMWRQINGGEAVILYTTCKDTQSSKFTIKYDNTLPTINTTHKTENIVQVYASDTETEIKELGISTNSDGTNISWQDSKDKTFFLGNAEKYYFYAKDGVNNISLPYTVETDETANIPPVTPIITHNGKGEYNKSNVTVSINKDTNKTEYQINNGAWQTYTNPFTISTTSTIVAKSTNKKGQSAISTPITINIDKTIPNLTLSLSNTTNVNENINIIGKATDIGSSVDRIEAPNGTIYNSANFTY